MTTKIQEEYQKCVNKIEDYLEHCPFWGVTSVSEMKKDIMDIIDEMVVNIQQ